MQDILPRDAGEEGRTGHCHVRDIPIDQPYSHQIGKSYIRHVHRQMRRHATLLREVREENILRFHNVSFPFFPFLFLSYFSISLDDYP